MLIRAYIHQMACGDSTIHFTLGKLPSATCFVNYLYKYWQFEGRANRL